MKSPQWNSHWCSAHGIWGAHFTHSTIAKNRFWGPLKVCIQHNQPDLPSQESSKLSSGGLKGVGSEVRQVHQKCRVLPWILLTSGPRRSLGGGAKIPPYQTWGGIWDPKNIPKTPNLRRYLEDYIGLNETVGFFLSWQVRVTYGTKRRSLRKP